MGVEVNRILAWQIIAFAAMASGPFSLTALIPAVSLLPPFMVCVVVDRGASLKLLLQSILTSHLKYHVAKVVSVGLGDNTEPIREVITSDMAESGWVNFELQEDDLSKISTSIYVTNFPDTFTAKELFQTCKQYGHVVDAFIPNKSKIQANIARFRRSPLNNNNVKSKHNEARKSGGAYDMRTKGLSNSSSFASVVAKKQNASAVVLVENLRWNGKEVLAALTNLKSALRNEGFVDIKIRFLGELWVLLDFKSSKIKDLFQGNVGAKSWFTEIIQASLDFNPDRQLSRVEKLKEYHISKVYWLRAKEVLGWEPELVEDSDGEDEEEEEHSDKASLDGELKEQDDENDAGHSNLEALLQKNGKDRKETDQNVNQSLQFPPGFTPVDKEQSSRINGEEVVIEKHNEGVQNEDQEGVQENFQQADTIKESVSTGRFKDTKNHRSGGSFMCLMEEVDKVGSTMGYNMEGVINNMSQIIETQGESMWLKSGIDLIIVAVYGPHDPRDKRMVWECLSYVINHGMGAEEFNAFIADVGLEEVPLGGSSFTWCHKSATKMSKLDRFFVSNSLLNSCPHFSAITLERCLSDHRPILLRELNFDYGPTPFRFFHHWIELDGFSNFVSDVWKSAPGSFSSLIGIDLVNQRMHRRDSIECNTLSIIIRGNKPDWNEWVTKERVETAVVGLRDGISLQIRMEFDFGILSSFLTIVEKDVFGQSRHKVKQAANKIGCLILSCPFSYLGSKVGVSMSRIQDWREVIDKMKHRLSKWKMKSLSIGGRLTLLKSVLGSIPIFNMSIFKVPLMVLKEMESIRGRFFNGHEFGSRKASWIKWEKVLASKDKGGLGVSSLFALNRGLLIKWVWRFFNKESSLWKKVIVAIHGADGNICSVKA
ncbi:RNA-directed DNA polymerase, eukaryota [Tanacetum coccineum]